MCRPSRWISSRSLARFGALTAFAVVAMLSLGACSGPAADPPPTVAQVNGTISGNVVGPAGENVIEGRAVEVIDVASGERQQDTTSSTGSFRFKVKPGTYRVEVTLRDGESVITAPGVINVNSSAVDAHADVVVGGGHRSPRRPPAGTTTSSILGSPIA